MADTHYSTDVNNKRRRKGGSVIKNASNVAPRNDCDLKPTLGLRLTVPCWTQEHFVMAPDGTLLNNVDNVCRLCRVILEVLVEL